MSARPLNTDQDDYDDVEETVMLLFFYSLYKMFISL